MSDVPVVVLPSGVNGLAWIRSLGRRKVRVIAADENPRCLGRASVYASEFFRCPSAREHPDDLVDGLLRQAPRWGRAVLVPTGDDALEVLSRNRERLREKFFVPVSGWECAGVLLDKQACYSVAEKLGLATPRTFQVTPDGEIHGNLSELSYPCIVKPLTVHRFGYIFHTKMFEAHSAEEARRYVDLAREHGTEVIVQEVIPGGSDRLHVYSACYDEKSRPVAEMTWRKRSSCPPMFGVTRVCVSTRNQDIVELSRKILDHLRFVGISDVEFKLDPRDGRYKLIEINGRSPLQIQLPVACGMDLPWIQYRAATGTLAPEDIPASYRTGVHWISLFGELEVLLRYRGQERQSWAERLAPYRGPIAWEVWDRRDPRPLWAALGSFARGGLRVVKRRLKNDEV